MRMSFGREAPLELYFRLHHHRLQQPLARLFSPPLPDFQARLSLASLRCCQGKGGENAEYGKASLLGAWLVCFLGACHCLRQRMTSACKGQTGSRPSLTSIPEGVAC